MLTTLLAGLAVGAIYAFIAMGTNITHMGAGVINFAFAHLVILGAFIGVWGFRQGLPAPVVFLVAGLVCAVVGFLEERLAIRPLRNTGTHTEMITTIGFATLLGGVFLLVAGPDPYPLPFVGRDEPWRVGSNLISPLNVTLIITVATTCVLLHLLFNRTAWGLQSQARSEDREAALLRGVNVRMIGLTAFVGSAFLAGLMGPLVGSKTYAVATIPLLLAIKGFVALTMGGIGSMPGACIGGFALGVIEAFAARYVGDSYRELSVFAVFIAVLILRPQGMFGQRAERTV